MPNRNKVLNWSITFPQTEVTRKDFLESLPPLKKAICCRETHEDGGFHLHAGITLKKGLTKVQLLYYIKKKYPNDYKRIDVQGTRNNGNWEEYLLKEDPEVLVFNHTAGDAKYGRLRALVMENITYAPCSEWRIMAEGWLRDLDEQRAALSQLSLGFRVMTDD